MQAVPEEARSARAAVAVHVDDILARRNVVGCGVGRRTVGGQRTDEWAVVVFVSSKLPRESLRASELVPSELQGEDEPVRTDVVEAAPQHLLADTAKYRPLRGGCQIMDSGGWAGTLGGIVYDSTDYEPVMLTCNHVLTFPGSRDVLPENTRVYQPSVADSPGGWDYAGKSKRIVPWQMAPLGSSWALQARVDAGIVSVVADVDVQFDVIELGKHPYVVLPAYEGLDVVKRGAGSMLTTGTVECTDITWIVEVDGKRVRFGGDSVFSIHSPADAAFAVGGDSGSLVIDADGGAARGLVFSSDLQPGGLAYACDLRAVMEELGCETPCTGGLGGMIRRAIFRRSTTAFEAARPHNAGTTGPGKKNAFLDEAVRRVDRFRHGFLDGDHGHLGGIIGETLSLLAVDLSEAVYADEDVAGLLDAAFGDWLAEPTVYDMLEYRLPDLFAARVIEALERLPEGPSTKALRWLRPALADVGGMKVRDVLQAPAPRRDAAAT